MMGSAVKYAAWTGGGALIAAALLLFDAGTSAGAPPRWMAVWALAGAALIWLACQSRPKIDLLDGVALALLAWAALSLAWSGDPKAGLLHWQHMAALFAVAWLFRKTKFLDPVLAPVLAGSIIAAAGMATLPNQDWFISILSFLGATEYAVAYIGNVGASHGGFGNENFIAEFMIIAGALLIVVPGRFDWLTTAALGIGTAYLMLGNGSHVPFAAAAALLGLLTYMAMCRGYVVLWAMLLTAGGLFAGWMLVSGHGAAIGQSFVERAEMWINTAYMILANPIGGVGFGAFDFAYPRVMHAGLIDGTFLGSPTDYVGAAHNDWLQGVAELGLVGAGLAGTLIWLVLRHGEDRDYRAPLFFAAVLACVGFPLQNPMTALLIAVAAGMAARGKVHSQRTLPATNLAGLLVLPLAVSGFLFYQSAMQARDIYAAIKVSPVHALNSQLAALKTYDLDPWLRLQSMLTLASVLRTYPPNQVDLEPEAADEIYATALSAAPRMPGLLIARAEYLINSGRWRDGDELEGVVARLQEYGPWYPETWALSAMAAGLAQDAERAEQAVVAALALPGGREVFARMGMLKTETAQ